MSSNFFSRLDFALPAAALPNEVKTIERSNGRVPFLEFLQYLFNTLVVLNEAYLHMYPAPRQHPPCKHVPQQQGPGHLTAMTGQSERMAFVGMLLRSADQIGYIKKMSVEKGHDFASKVKGMKQQHPAIAHGVAVLHFLTAGLCKNDSETLKNLFNLVVALKESYEKCKHTSPPLSGQLIDLYNGKSCNRILSIVAVCLQKRCSHEECSSLVISECEKNLGAYLDPKNWRGCADCESMLVDILMYNIIFVKTNRRMMASLKLSFNYATNDQGQNTSSLTKYLCSHGFVEVEPCETQLLDNTCLLDTLCSYQSAAYEAIYISGYKNDNKGSLHQVMEVLLDVETKVRRPFFIQNRYQVEGNNDSPHCCEPQIMLHLKAVISKLAHLPKFIKVCIVLEQEPCDVCSAAIMPTIATQLAAMNGHIPIPPQLTLVSMLPYKKKSVFLKRLTCAEKDGRLVQLMKDLQPFKERHACMVQGRCRYVRCNEYCHYSKPSKVIEIVADASSLHSHNLYNSPEIQYDFSPSSFNRPLPFQLALPILPHCHSADCKSYELHPLIVYMILIMSWIVKLLVVYIII